MDERKKNAPAQILKAPPGRRAIKLREFVIVRDAKLVDYSEYNRLWAELEKQHAQVAPGFFSGEYPNMSKDAFSVLLRDRYQQILVASGHREHLYGVIKLSLYNTPEKTEMTNNRRVLIDGIATDARYRRCGIGRYLVSEAQNWARKQGAKQLLLTSWAGNVPARQFYEELGFTEVSRVYAIDLYSAGHLD